MVRIKIKDWDYTCGDGCCYTYGTEIYFNDKLCDNSHAGGDVVQALNFVLSELGVEFEIIEE